MKANIKKLDKLWGECIAKKFHGRDIWKGGVALDPHHIVHRSLGYSIRWELENGIYLSRTNHQYAHTTPGQEEFMIWFEKNFPGKYDELLLQAHSIKKVDLEEVEENLRRYLA